MLGRLIRISVLLLPLYLCMPMVSVGADIADYEVKAEQAFKQGYYSRAVMYYTRIIRALPEDTNYRARLGQIQLLRGKLVEAREQAKEILARDASHKDGLILMSKIALGKQAWEEAYGYLQKLVQNYPDEPYSYLGLSSVYSSRDDNKAEKTAFETYQRLLRIEAGNE